MALMGCGGGGGGGDAAKPGSIVTVEDGVIIGAMVKDSNDKVANEKGNGVYQFPSNYRNPVFPIMVTSQNTIINGAAVGNIVTYQDVNADGDYDEGVDVPFNSSMQVAYSDNPLKINVNPISALIPASGVIPAAGIGGLSREMVLSAMNDGLVNNQSSEIDNARRVAAQIVSIAEVAVLQGVPIENSQLLIKAIADAVVANPSLNLVSDFSGVVTAIEGNADVQSAYTGVNDSVTNNPVALSSVGPVLIAFATSVESVTGLTNTISSTTNYESIVKALQVVVAANSNLSSVDSVINNLTNDGGAVESNELAQEYFKVLTDQQTDLVEAENQQTGVENLLQSLYLMPAYYEFDTSGPLLDGTECVACEIGVLDNDLENIPYQVTNFAMSYQSTTDTITLLDDGAFANLQLQSSESCKFTGSSCYKYTDQQLLVEVYINWQGMRVMLYDYGVSFDFPTGGSSTTHVFALANQEQICGFTLSSGASLGQTQLDQINSINAANVVCP